MTELFHYGVKGMKWGENLFGDELDDAARRTARGEFGNGEERKKQLGQHYAQIQARVNELMKGSSNKQTSSEVDNLAYQVISGQYGNGAERRIALGDKYQEVQARVNEILKNQAKANEIASTQLNSVDPETKAAGKEIVSVALNEKGEEMVDVSAPGITHPMTTDDAKSEIEKIRAELKEEIMKELGLSSSASTVETKSSTKKKTTTKKETKEEVEEEESAAPKLKAANRSSTSSSTKKDEEKKPADKKPEIKNYNIERNSRKPSESVKADQKKSPTKSIGKTLKESWDDPKNKTGQQKLEAQERAVNELKKSEDGFKVKDNKALNQRLSLRKSKKKKKTKPKVRTNRRSVQNRIREER